MAILAKAHPQKRLFISLLTRDIGLADAFLDVIDNSINAALKQLGLGVNSSADYIDLLSQERRPKHFIKISYDENSVRFVDNCGGIAAKDAEDKVFVFGASDQSHLQDRLSVYGIGLKRAMFKLGNRVVMRSDHPDGGFDLDLNVAKWESKVEESWTFPISKRSSTREGRTTLMVSELYSDVKSRLGNSAFESELSNKIAYSYSFFIGKVVDIHLNDRKIPGRVPEIGGNQASETYQEGEVSVAVSAGLGEPGGSGHYSAETAGWNIFCNGRAVIVNDRSRLTGWGIDGFLPSFKPKHRPFVGVVFFTSDNPELLPWTTTKLGVNPDNIVWQRALRRMADVGRQVTRFLDSRYQEEGTVITKDELVDAIGERAELKLAVTAPTRTFSAPKRKSSALTSIQFKVDKKLLSRVKAAIGAPSMSNAEVGQYILDYFVESELD